VQNAQGTSTQQAELKAETEKKIALIDKAITSQTDQVVGMLLDLVTKV